ncbi:hypothetical protein MGG_11489 [Pyricularia oryzae 70-15]|uniref:Uncharacterized protein n=3 Tax=Pyricularia oryzae TaxID=318829 RepID=G4NEA4_PYRO7|nr:uncharacterized protein MGG_11489 [Pyricularia oryzae 70-15]EHA48587.1 hypothetical protein MGG_11489 [Pyricularia oryzae 70-15]ELQ32962.1 hypothetical protein OOU_Y34scaffold01007g11 [Pyricularia oryzae Y34]KAI7920213.1 hypothetical protein M9X92_006058 [Pyricularia oryzae]KAI7924525.1 hypothetical protein M0657_004569 [Pyricularia oryzae]
MSAARDPTSRLRAGLNPLLTSLAGYGNQSNTPHSAMSMTSHNGFSTMPTPVSAIQPYNPQEWIASPAPGSERNSQRFSSSGESTGSSLPPPPYSPPRSQQPPGQVYENSPVVANTSALRSAPPPQSHLRQSPDQQYPTNSQAFPPPPPNAGRVASRDRRFGIPSLLRRDRDSPDATTPPDTYSPGHGMYPSTSLSASLSTSRPQIPAPLSLQIPQAPEAEPGQVQQLPPSARRTQSTGSIGTPTSARSRSASQVRWGSNMPVPPPPPGPPPPGGRSQSLCRPSNGSDPIMSPPTRRPPPSGVTALGPVPPTPANWHEMEDNDHNRSHTPPTRPPLITSSSAPTSNPPHQESQGSSSAPGSAQLIRTGAVRGEKTLRERRSESRARGIHDSIDASLESAESSGMSDIVIPNPNRLSRRLTITRGTPRSERTTIEAPLSADESTNITPRALASAPAAPSHYLETPPFSPCPQKPYQLNDNHGPMAPKALPTPPPQTRSASSSQVRSASNSQTRLTLDTSKSGQMSPRQVTKESVVKQTPDQFCRGTIERFKAFAHKEAAVADDAERVRLFAEFIVSESRLRRERYASSIGAMGSEVLDLTRDLFRPMSTRRASVTSQASAAEFTPQTSEPSRSHRGSVGSMHREEPQLQVDRHGKSNWAPSSAGLPPSPGMPGPSNQNWQQSSTNYMPSLSPILSMSVSDALDEQDSRGRPASRWWETDSNGTPSMRMERSKRESKYMGVPKEGREALQWSDDPANTYADAAGKREADSEYPPEKSGWHEGSSSSEAARTPQPKPRNVMVSSSYSTPSTPDPSHLDVSRLVTLPPPYPRHHPAVNNNHPELTDTRVAVRAISDFTEIETTKARFITESKKKREEATAASKKRISSLRSNLQQEIACGNMTYAEAAAIEDDSAVAERGAAKDMEKADFERFQQVVVAPLNDLLTGRIAKATALFDELRSQIFSEAREPSPNNPQEEGDERPELLEKLTLLKWIFEAREVLHRAIYDILTDRNDRYRDVVLTPYKLLGNAEKLASARAFFAEDSAKRAAAFATESLQRAREFRDVVEENVSRGVEVQLSAFWDIAPPLKNLLDGVPLDLRGFRIQVPVKEVLENPSYEQHPLQHLFSVLLHAEKSTYQFIESQTNLLCLLHEVKESVAVARAKAVAAERTVAALSLSGAAGGDGAAPDGEEDPSVRDMREAESRALTEDLKEKVRVVQDQWNSALGDCINGVKERVGEWLLETGGWDESLEDGGVGRG